MKEKLLLKTNDDYIELEISKNWFDKYLLNNDLYQKADLSVRLNIDVSNYLKECVKDKTILHTFYRNEDEIFEIYICKLNNFVFKLHYVEKYISSYKIYTKLENGKLKAYWENLISDIKKIKENYIDDTHKIHLIIQSSAGLELMSNKIKDVPKLNLDHYNDDFKEFNHLLSETINEKGLTLIHGEPGTGKTTYIKMLTKMYSKKNFIFIPPTMSHVLSDPNLIGFLLENKNSVLVIEDAENSLITRSEDSRSPSVSNILNMSDGILSDILNIHIIATFNTNIKELDPALLRAGRLKTRYEFKKLNKIKASKLSGKDENEDKTLASLFNDEKLFNKINPRKNIGFGK